MRHYRDTFEIDISDFHSERMSLFCFGQKVLVRSQWVFEIKTKIKHNLCVEMSAIKSCFFSFSVSLVSAQSLFIYSNYFMFF